MTGGAAPGEWAHIRYPFVRLPAKGGKVRQARRPALRVRARPPSSPAGSDDRHTIEYNGILDTGADASVMPMWLLRRTGIPLDKKTRREVYSVSGPLAAYSAKVGTEIECNGTWLDIGVSEVFVPDTPW